MTRWKYAVYLPLAGLVLLGLFFIYGEVRDWYNPLQQATKIVRVPIKVPIVKELRVVETKVIRVPVKVYVPTEKEEAKLEKEFHVNLGEGGKQTLGIYDGPKAPHGSSIIAELTPEGETKVTVVPKRASFFAISEGPWEIGAGLLYDMGGERGGRLHIGKDAFRAGRVSIRAEGDLDFLDGETTGRVALLAVVRL